MTQERIIEVVLDVYNLTILEILGKSRAKNIPAAKQCAQHLMARLLKMPDARIAKVFSIDRTTSISNRQQFAKIVKRSQKESDLYAKVCEILIVKPDMKRELSQAQQDEQKEEEVTEVVFIDPPSKPKYSRPPAIYSNRTYHQVLNDYGV